MPTEKTFDVIIAGGGIIGSAAAYYLTSREPSARVLVVERDQSYERASSTLSMANARIQFSLKQNIEISQYALQVLSSFEEDMKVNEISPRIAYRREGNLFLVDKEGEESARRSFELQKQLGCRIQWWKPDQIKSRYPLYDPSGYIGGTFGPDDGHFDAYAVLMGYRAKARAQGAEYRTAEAAGILTANGRVEGLRLADGQRLSAGHVINCAGAWAAQLAETAGVKLPVIPVKRQVFALDTAVKPDGPLPLTVLPSGLYFRTETGGLILLGKSLPEDPVGVDFRWDDKRFVDLLWPELAAFVPGFDRLKIVRGWAGLYAVNTLDGNAIIGEWPGLKGFYLANGFSGHGLQQAPAVGRHLSELILGLPVALDLSIFTPQRIIENRPLSEAGLV